MNKEKLHKIIPILRSPRTGERLQLRGDSLVTDSGDAYPIVNGKPVLVKTIKSLHITPPSQTVVSKNITEYSLNENVAELKGFKLHLGSGDVPCKDPNVISIDILPNHNVDIVAEAEFLPFMNDSLVWVEAGAVFEHLYNPLISAKEVRRVLKPGGMLCIDTAFMQAYHRFPSHYFNMTPQAVETFIVDDFILEQSYIPVGAGPVTSVSNLFRRFFENAPVNIQKMAESMTIIDFIEYIDVTVNKSGIHHFFSDHIKRSLAASICVVAKKPDDYEKRRLALSDEELCELAELKRDYYAGRVEIIQRYHEVQFYSMKARVSNTKESGLPLREQLDELLLVCSPKDTLAKAAWQKSLDLLQQISARLTKIRDSWNVIYLREQRS